jgi:hypothetical protein
MQSGGTKAQEVFGLLVVGQQARQQFFGYVVFLGAHFAYGQAGLRRRLKAGLRRRLKAGLRRRLIVRLHKILHTLWENAMTRNRSAHPRVRTPASPS